MLQLSAVDPNTLNLEPVPEFWPNLVTGMLSIFKSTYVKNSFKKLNNLLFKL